MTATEIATSADRLGIKLTRAPVGSEVWECWADQVKQADAYDVQFDAEDWPRSHERFMELRAAAVSAANAAAV